MTKRPSAKSLAPKSGEHTETGQQIKGALSGIGQGLSALFSEKPSAPQQERPVLPMTWKGPSGRDTSESDNWHGKSEGKPQKPAAGDSTWRDWSAGRSQGSRGHFDEGHR